MNKYRVIYQQNVIVTVTAENEDQAVELAMDADLNSENVNIEMTSDLPDVTEFKN